MDDQLITSRFIISFFLFVLRIVTQTRNGPNYTFALQDSVAKTAMCRSGLVAWLQPSGAYRFLGYGLTPQHFDTTNSLT